MIYNEDIKKLYLEHIAEKSYLDVMSTCFNNCSDIEQTLKKDISNFNLADILGYYKTLGTSSAHYLQVINSRFTAYTNWCLDGNLVADKQNHFKEIHVKELEDCINKQLWKREIISRKDLLGIIGRQELNASENFLLLALFEGIYGKQYQEIRQLYYKDFNKNKVKLCTGRELTVSDKLVELAKESSETYTYLTSDNRERKYKLDEGRCFKFPEITSTEGEVIYISKRLGLIKKEYDYYFAKRDLLKESGRIDMIKGLMKKNDWTAEECVRNKLKDIEYRYGHLISIPAYLSEYNEVLEEA